MAALSQRQAIDFGPYVARATRGFTGGEWVLEGISRWLADDQLRQVFLLTGEPGSGKTAIAGRLWQISRGEAPPSPQQPSRDAVSAAYFCAAPAAGDRRWINPTTFATSISLQLAARYPAFAAALVEQVASRRVHIDVTQTIDTVTGTAIGVAIERLNIGGLSAEDAFGFTVREPLETL